MVGFSRGRIRLQLSIFSVRILVGLSAALIALREKVHHVARASLPGEPGGKRLSLLAGNPRHGLTPILSDIGSGQFRQILEPHWRDESTPGFIDVHLKQSICIPHIAHIFENIRLGVSLCFLLPRALPPPRAAPTPLRESCSAFPSAKRTAASSSDRASTVRIARWKVGRITRT